MGQGPFHTGVLALSEHEIELKRLIAEARRNEEIMRRVEAVEDLLFGHLNLQGLIDRLCPRVEEVYQLQAVTLALSQDHDRLMEAVFHAPGLELPHGCFTRPRKEIRLLLSDLERPFLSREVNKDLGNCFFPDRLGLNSMAVVPLWARGQFLGTLNLGSASPRRYHPQYQTDFLGSLGRKVALGLEAALLAEETQHLQRREAAVEMAGAACHELAQPLTTIGLLLEKAKRLWPDEDEKKHLLEELERELEKVNQQVLRISQVSQYVTKPYAQGLNIIDLDAAQDQPGGKGPRGE